MSISKAPNGNTQCRVPVTAKKEERKMSATKGTCVSLSCSCDHFGHNPLTSECCFCGWNNNLSHIYIRPKGRERTIVSKTMMKAVLFLLVAAGCCLAQPEYTTPGGILTTNCMKGCTEIVVHESNCCKYAYKWYIHEIKSKNFTKHFSIILSYFFMIRVFFLSVSVWFLLLCSFLFSSVFLLFLFKSEGF